MNKITYSVLVVLFLGLSVTKLHASDLPRTASPEGAQAYIVSPKDGETVAKTFSIVFGLKGMGVAPAGVDKAKTGHHHLLIDSDQLPPENLPMGDQVTHFGGGQTETTVTLEPGKHTLQLILGDKFHIPHNPPVVSEQITIYVE